MFESEGNQEVKTNTFLSICRECQDLGAGWKLLPAPAACPSPAVLPPCLPMSPLHQTTAPPHHGHAGAPPPEKEEDWAPAMWAGSKILHFFRCRLQPTWMSLAQASQPASPGKSCTVLPRHQWPHGQSARWSQLGHLHCAPHPKVVGTLSRVGINDSWGFLINNRKFSFNVGKEKMLWSALRLHVLENWRIHATPWITYPHKKQSQRTYIFRWQFWSYYTRSFYVADLKLWPVLSLPSLFPWLFSLTLPATLFSRRLLCTLLTPSNSSLLSFTNQVCFTPSVSVSCLHHHTLLKVILGPPGLLIFHPHVDFSCLPCPSPSCPGIKHLWFLIIIQKTGRRHNTLHILVEGGLVTLQVVPTACWVGA